MCGTKLAEAAGGRERNLTNDAGNTSGFIESLTVSPTPWTGRTIWLELGWFGAKGSKIVKLCTRRKALIIPFYNHRMRSRVIELNAGQPESAMARSNSCRIISRTYPTPASPPQANPHTTALQPATSARFTNDALIAL